MSDILNVPGLPWDYHLEEVLGLVFVLGLIAAYSLLFAVTRTRGAIWLAVSVLAIVAMSFLIAISPREKDREDGVPMTPSAHVIASSAR